MTQADEIDILPDAVGDAVNVKGASDADIKKALLHPRLWSYAVRGPGGAVSCWGRGKTRAECEHFAVEDAVACAYEITGRLRRLEGWQFLIWPPSIRDRKGAQ